MKKVLLLLLMMILLPLKVYADSSITVVCSPSSVKVNDTVNCKISGNSEANITKFNANIIISNDITVEELTPSSQWSGDISEGVINMSIANVTGTFDIGTINLKVKENTMAQKITLSITNATFIDDGNNPIVLTNATGSFDIEATNNEPETTPKGLKTLTVTNGTLSPQFTANNTGYTITLNSADTQTFKINATALDENDRIVYVNGETNTSIDNNNLTFSTSNGKSEMPINIIVGEGERQITYNILVNKPQKQEIEPAELVTLVVGGENIPLIKGQFEYIITLDDISSYKLDATLKDSNNYRFSEYTIPLLSPYQLSNEQEIPIVIEPKDATTGLSSVTYVITVKGRKQVVNNSTTTTTKQNNSNSSSNPQTGGTSAFVVGILLIVSFSISIYLYKKNMNGYSE